MIVKVIVITCLTFDVRRSTCGVLAPKRRRTGKGRMREHQQAGLPPAGQVSERKLKRVSQTSTCSVVLKVGESAHARATDIARYLPAPCTPTNAQYLIGKTAHPHANCCDGAICV